MKEKRSLSSILYIAIFAVCIIGLGLLSFIKLMDHYVNDEEDMNRWVPSNGSRFETDLANNFFLQFDFVNLNGLMAKVIGKHELNNIVKLENGYLFEPSPYFDEEVVQKNTDNIIALKDNLEARGIKFIFAVTPNTSAKYDPQVPNGYTDFGNENLDRIASALRLGGVNVIDFRDELYADGSSVHKAIVDEWKCPYHNGRMCLQMMNAKLPEDV